MVNEIKRTITQINSPYPLRPDDAGTYKIVVEFTRSLAEDLPVLADQGKAAAIENLVEQLCRELQPAYDELGMAGHFVVLSIEVPSDIP